MSVLRDTFYGVLEPTDFFIIGRVLIARLSLKIQSKKIKQT